ncbi:MAG: NnrS family protein [Gemmatimonas sp.]
MPHDGATRARPGGPAVLSAGFRPFFLLGACWSAVAIPLWLAMFDGTANLPTVLLPWVWHAHEMVFGYAMAAVAGFLLTAIPNWTGRLPIQGAALGGLVALWLGGRIATLASATIGAGAAAAIDLAFPAAFLAVVAREIVAGRNWRNLPMLVALSLLLAANALVHAEALALADTAELGIRLGIGVLMMLIALVGGRIIPSFTGNWLAKARPDVPRPAPTDRLDTGALILTAAAVAAWVAAPTTTVAAGLAMVSGVALAARLSRWRGRYTTAEPLLWVLHVGYAWLALGAFLLGVDIATSLLPATSALHAVTAGAVGTMTLAVMTRATLGHTGAALTAGAGTTAIYLLVTIAALLRVGAPLAGAGYGLAVTVAGVCWTGAFALYAALYGPRLLRPRGSA